MALERVPADIRRDGGVARMTDPKVSIVTCSTCSNKSPGIRYSELL